MMCRQIVRKRLRDHPAGLSALSNTPSHLSGHPISLRIHASIRGEILPSTNFWLFFFSKKSGRKTIVRSSATSKKWIVSGKLSDLPQFLTWPPSRNSSVGSNRSILTISLSVHWKSSILRTIPSRLPLSILPASPAGTAAIITHQEPERSENISWKPQWLSIPINRLSPDSSSRKAGYMIPNTRFLFWKDVMDSIDLTAMLWTGDMILRKYTGLSAKIWMLSRLFLPDDGKVLNMSGENTERKWPITSTLSGIANGSWLKQGSLSWNEGSELIWNPGYFRSRRRKSLARSFSLTWIGSFDFSGSRFSTEHIFSHVTINNTFCDIALEVSSPIML